eukprot:10977450-Ditylum_brightwellii.AAC.1
MKVLVSKIQQWYGEETTSPRIPPDDLGKLLTGAVEDQHDLGWDNMMKGCISTKWGRAQQKHFEIFYPKSTTNSRECWEKDLITPLWNCFYHIWAYRNDIIHNSAHDPD